MATFISTIQLTEKGLKDIRESCQRAEGFKTTAAGMGVSVKHLYWSLGGVDGLLIFDAPDEATASAAMLHLSSLGNVSTRTSIAFDSEEMANVLSKLP